MEVLAITVGRENCGEVPSIAGVWEISGGAQTVWSLKGWKLLEAPQTQKTSLNSRKLQNMQFDEYYKNPAESGLEIFGSPEEEVDYIKHSKGR